MVLLHHACLLLPVTGQVDAGRESICTSCCTPTLKQPRLGTEGLLQLLQGSRLQAPATPPLPAQLMEHLVNCNCDCQRASGLSVLGLGQVELPVFQENSPQALEPGPRGF